MKNTIEKKEVKKNKKKRSGNLFIISAPSGAGKTTLCNKVRELFSNINYSISYTTRSPRTGEKNGIDYFFISKEEFIEGIKADKWVEWAEVHGNYYGTSSEFLIKILNEGENLLLDIDVQGAMQIKGKFPDAITIFIMPPSLEVLKNRLVSRETDSPEVIAKRMENAKKEIDQKSQYQYILVNDDLSKAIKEFVDIFMRYIK